MSSTLPEEVATILQRKADFGAVERQSVEKQVESITNEVVVAVKDVIKAAEDLEALVVQNAARVKVELTEHIDLAKAAKSQAADLSAVITRLRDAQAALSTERKNGQAPH